MPPSFSFVSFFPSSSLPLLPFSIFVPHFAPPLLFLSPTDSGRVLSPFPSRIVSRCYPWFSSLLGGFIWLNIDCSSSHPRVITGVSVAHRSRLRGGWKDAPVIHPQKGRKIRYFITFWTKTDIDAYYDISVFLTMSIIYMSNNWLLISHT